MWPSTPSVCVGRNPCRVAGLGRKSTLSQDGQVLAHIPRVALDNLADLVDPSAAPIAEKLEDRLGYVRIAATAAELAACRGCRRVRRAKRLERLLADVPARPEPGRAEPAVANHEVDCRPRHAEYLSHLREAAKAPLILCVFGRRHRSHCGGLLRASGGCGPWVLCGPSAPCARKATMLGRWLSMSSASSGVTGWTADRTHG